MDAISDFFSNGYTMIGMAVLLAALIAVYFAVKGKGGGDDA